MAVIEKNLVAGSQDTLLTGANLNAMASSTSVFVLGSAFDPAIGAAGDGYPFAEFEGYFDFAGTVTANTAIDVWFAKAPDGTNYSDGSTSVVPSRAPDVSFVLRGVSGAHQQRVVGIGRGGARVELPAVPFKCLVRNSSTGSAIASNTNSFVKMRRFARYGVTA